MHIIAAIGVLIVCILFTGVLLSFMICNKRKNSFQAFELSVDYNKKPDKYFMDAEFLRLSHKVFIRDFLIPEHLENSIVKLRLALVPVCKKNIEKTIYWAKKNGFRPTTKFESLVFVSTNKDEQTGKKIICPTIHEYNGDKFFIVFNSDSNKQRELNTYSTRSFKAEQYDYVLMAED